MNVVKQKESEMGCTEEAQKININMTKPAPNPQGKFISIHELIVGPDEGVFILRTILSISQMYINVH